MNEHENTVHALWIGKLHDLEIVTMRSFLDKGASFNLWVYDQMEFIPEGVIIRDANEIIPKEKVFLYPEKMDWGSCAKTVIGFSEHFRYKVMYEYGGWWSDLDITCLKPISEITEPYFFRPHLVLPVVGNIMKCPPKSELMRLCYETAIQEVNENTRDMYLAIEILGYYIRFLGLRNYIKYDYCNLDDWYYLSPYYHKEHEPFPQDWYFVHWMHSFITDHKYYYLPNSAFGILAEKWVPTKARRWNAKYKLTIKNLPLC